MNDVSTLDLYGELIEPTTLKIQRLLPGPIERCWSYLTDSDLRRKWLASGDMQMKSGSSFELVWRNDELGTPAGRRPEGFPAEHRMASRIVEIDPPRRLVFTWGANGEVTFELAPSGGEVMFTVIHRRIPDRSALLLIGPGWHMHLDTLLALARGKTTEPFWDGWLRLQKEYERRIPA